MGLNIDCSEWVKLGVMDEAERLDRHWASWSNFTQASDICVTLCIPLVISFSPIGRVLVFLRGKKLLRRSTN